MTTVLSNCGIDHLYMHARPTTDGNSGLINWTDHKELEGKHKNTLNTSPVMGLVTSICSPLIYLRYHDQLIQKKRKMSHTSFPQVSEHRVLVFSEYVRQQQSFEAEIVQQFPL